MLAAEDNGLSPSITKHPEKVSSLKTIAGEHREDSTGGPTNPPKTCARRFTPPFPRSIYDCFVDALQKGSRDLPTSKQLRLIGYHGTRSICPRQKFRLILPRLEVKSVDGAMVFSSKPKEQVLIIKRTRKIILPAEDFERAIRRAHFTGSNVGNGHITDETKQQHLSFRKTLTVLAKDFATKGRNFGINKSHVKEVVDNCRSCGLAEISSDEDSKAQTMSVTSNSNNGKSGGFKKPTAQNGVVGQQNTLLRQPKYPELPNNARFSSMAAAIPDMQCIWYGREGIARATNRFTKLLLLLNEIRGEIPLAAKGDAEAKQRLDTKLFVGQYLVKEYLKNVQKTLYNGCVDSAELTKTQFENLEEAYRQAGQGSIFECDLKSAINVDKSKDSLPAELVQQIENFLTSMQTREHKNPKQHETTTEP